LHNDHGHLSDEDLLLAADREPASRQARRIRAHVAGCASCRTHLAQMEKVSADVARAHRESLDSVIPSAVGPRALLRIRLAQISQSSPSASPRRLALGAPWLGWAAAAAVFSVGLAAGVFAFRPAAARQGARPATAFASGFVPNRSLTPGATRPVSMDEVCSMPHEEVVKEVSATMRARVFQEYGIRDARPGDYEIDYLITPGLGGIADIHNLWPEPYRVGAWDARAKDALEERLHELVCTRKLDLLTAQRAIASNWIAAYEKYFDTDKPQFVAGVPGALLRLRQRNEDRAG